MSLKETTAARFCCESPDLRYGVRLNSGENVKSQWIIRAENLINSWCHVGLYRAHISQSCFWIRFKMQIMHTSHCEQRLPTQNMVWENCFGLVGQGSFSTPKELLLSELSL